MRRRRPEKRIILPDTKYNDLTVAKFINYIMENGKKGIAEKIFYGAMNIIEKKTKTDGIKIFKKGIENASPSVEVKSRRIGGSIYQIPQEIKRSRGTTLAVKWLLQGAQSRNAFSFSEKLAQEIIDASQSLGSAIKKKEEVHRMAEANKAFAHFKS